MTLIVTKMTGQDQFRVHWRNKPDPFSFWANNSGPMTVMTHKEVIGLTQMLRIIASSLHG